MNIGTAYESMHDSSVVDNSTNGRDSSPQPDPKDTAESGGSERKENTAFEWVAASVKPREHGVIGLEFDGQSLIIIGAQKNKRVGHIIDHALVTRFDDVPSATTIASRLRTFVRRDNPDVHLVLSTARAVVRNFMLPAVPTRQREAAALWEGQKVVPFPLKDGAALYGLDFAAVGDRGWKTTLVAVSTADAAPILDAIDNLGWALRSISLIGTERVDHDKSLESEDVTAAVYWSDRRGCFAVYNRRQLVFHYDLGPMPAIPRGLTQGFTPESMPAWQRWLDGLGVSVSDALDFHLNVNPNIPPSSLQVYGLPSESAPLLTEWNNRFPSGVVLADAVGAYSSELPDGVRNWLSSKPGVITPALAALSGRATIDLTPQRLRHRRVLDKRARVARSVCVLSVVVCAAWSGLSLFQTSGHKAEVVRAQAAVAQMQSSPISIKLEAAVATASHTQGLLASASKEGTAWMPWFKTVLATIPVNAHLTHADVEYRSDRNALVAHLEGTLSPDVLAHAMTYREWFDQLQPLCSAPPVLVSERAIDFLGTKRSAFTIELVAPLSMASVAAVQP